MLLNRPLDGAVNTVDIICEQHDLVAGFILMEFVQVHRLFEYCPFFFGGGGRSQTIKVINGFR